VIFSFSVPCRQRASQKFCQTAAFGTQQTLSSRKAIWYS